MRIRPTDERVTLPLDRAFPLDDVIWTYKPPTNTWEITTGWMTLVFEPEEFEQFITASVTHWEREMWVKGVIPDVRRMKVYTDPANEKKTTSP